MIVSLPPRPIDARWALRRIWSANCDDLRFREYADHIIRISPTLDAVPVVRCKDCKHRFSSYNCPMRRIVAPADGMMHYEDFTTDEGFCYKGEKIGVDE